jgi:hypothetical protein
MSNISRASVPSGHLARYRAVSSSVQGRKAENPAYLSSGDLVARWLRGRARFCVTDFHFRETPLEHAVDLKPLSEFNLLARAEGLIGDEEVMSLVSY